MIKSCKLCPRACGAQRPDSGIGGGYCKMPDAPTAARAALHMWEEPCVSGENGSGTVFFSGCSLGCVYCQNSKISSEGFGEEITESRLSEIFDELEAQGAENINLVNPTHFAHIIARVLKRKKPNIPVVYNSSGYERVQTLKMLEGLIDVYLPDLKYITPEISLKYSGAADYFEYASKAVAEMIRQVGAPKLTERGIIKSGVIIRHLILPAHTNESIRVLRWISENLPREVPVSLMCQYIPCGRAEEFPEINRRLTRREYEKVISAMLSMGLENGFVQEQSSADKSYIPLFDLAGIKHGRN